MRLVFAVGRLVIDAAALVGKLGRGGGVGKAGNRVNALVAALTAALVPRALNVRPARLVAAVWPGAPGAGTVIIGGGGNAGGAALFVPAALVWAIQNGREAAEFVESSGAAVLAAGLAGKPGKFCATTPANAAQSKIQIASLAEPLMGRWGFSINIFFQERRALAGAASLDAFF